MNRYFAILLLCFQLITGVKCALGQLNFYEVEDIILTHTLIPSGPIPTAFDPNGVYPYVSYVETANRSTPVAYKQIIIENEILKVTICPDLGGKIYSMILKATGDEVLYKPGVIRPTRILPRFNFVAGGVEVSFPISHSPTQNNKVLSQIDKTEERIYVTCGERELRFGMQWSVEYSLGMRDSFLTQRVVLYNPGSNTYPWMSWSNAAIPSAHDTQFDFPDGRVLRHASRIDTIDWKTAGPKFESEISEMTGYFWLDKKLNAFGAFTPSIGTGLYHIADPGVAPGMKLWSYGTGLDSVWSTLSTSQGIPYVEIQGGPIGDQSIKYDLIANQIHSHTEYWFPTNKRLNIELLSTPKVSLRPIEQIPLFNWARINEVKIWNDLVNAYSEAGQLPKPPLEIECNWAPSGFENLDKPFKWAISISENRDFHLWQFYYGTWLAGRGDTLAAIDALSKSNLGVSKFLLARVLSLLNKDDLASDAVREISEKWLKHHPQIVIERDIILRRLSGKSIKERADWLVKVNSLSDEWVIERQVQLLLDQNNPSGAKELLLSTNFQKVHQTYTRTALWMQICNELNEPFEPIPIQLGEDRLARFGAYREFE